MCSRPNGREPWPKANSLNAVLTAGRHTLHYRRIADERENSNVTASTIIPKTNGPATQCFPTTFAGSPRVP
jgi:hypothetical protein